MGSAVFLFRVRASAANSSDSGCTTLNAIHVPDSYTQKWLKGQILCYVYFITIKKFSLKKLNLLVLEGKQFLIPRSTHGFVFLKREQRCKPGSWPSLLKSILFANLPAKGTPFHRAGGIQPLC